MILQHAEIEDSSLFVVNEPAPATAHDGSSLLIEVLLEGLEVTESFVNHGMEHAAWLNVAILDGTERLPEELVVEVATTVEADELLQANLLLQVSLVHGVDLLLHQLIEVVNIGAVVLAVVEVHQVSTHHGLECTKLVREVLKCD